MGKTKGKIHNNNFHQNKEILENEPPIKNNLIQHFPLKGDIKGKQNKNILDYSTWDIGTIGSQTGFSRNGSDQENEIIEGLDPFNKKTQIWKQIPDQTSGADGGWNSSSFSIDNTKLYRYTVWVKRAGSTNGTTYHGCHGYGSTSGVLNSTDGQNNTNPYFWYGNPPLDEWVLIVGHVHPAGTQIGIEHPDSGIYNTSGQKIFNIQRDFIWRTETTSANQRSYLYYCTDTNVRQYFAYPRVDVCDGTEPSLQDLIYSEGNITYPSNYKIRYIRDYLNGSTSNSGNHWVQLSAIDWKGYNVALNKPVTASSGGTNLSKVTDGTTNYDGYAYQTSGSEQYVEIDLEYKYDIKRIDLWHYWADGRTYHGTKTLVSQDGNTWFDVRNSTYDGEYQETSEGIIIYLNNENITHTTRTDYGLDIDQEKENVVINYNLDDYWSKNYCTDIKWNDIQPPDGINSNVVSFYDQGDKNGYWFCYGDYQPQTPGTEYTVSLYVKTNDSNFKIKFYTGDNSETGRIYGQFKSVPNDGKWHKIVWDSFINPSNSQSDSLSFNFTYGNDPGEGQRTWLCQPQMTQSNFSPGFRKKWRKQGQFRYLLDNCQEYTITGFFTPKTSFSNTLGYGETQNQSQLFRVQDKINTGGFYYRFYMGGSSCSPFLDPDGYYNNSGGSGHIHKQYEIDKNKELFFQIRKNGSTVKFKIYQEGWKYEHTMSTNSQQVLSEFILGISTLWNGSFNNISFYSAFLDDNDIDMFVKNNFSLKQNGNQIQKELVEDNNLLTRHGPTQFDTGVFGGIWGSYTQANCDVRIVKQPYKNYTYSYFIRRQPNIAQSSNWGGLRLSFPDDDMWEEGNTYKVSFKYKGYSKDTIAVYFAYQVGWGSMGVGLSTLHLPNITKNIDDEDGWQYYEGIFTIPSGYIHQVGTDGNTYFCMREFKIGYTYTTTDSIGTRLFINDLRMEKINEDKSFKTGIGQKTNGLYFNTFEENKLNAHIKAIGTQYTSTETFVPTTGNRVLELDGQSIYNTSGRGARLTIFKNDLSVILDTTYDIYGDDQARTNLQNQLNNLQDNEHFVITTYDQINSNQNLNQQFENLNSKIWTTLNSGRSPYQCYGKNKRIIYEDGARYDDYHKHKQVLDFII